jgi:DNA-binding NarL/FixJ family response regulator
MRLLEKKTDQLPHVLFLDLNIPRKNGLECLSEIKLNKKLKHLFIIIFSTSSEQDIVNVLYKNGAHHYIRKPAEFSQLKKVILKALTLITDRMPAGEGNFEQPSKEMFVLTGDF